jgi:hypothetical protein
MTSLRENQPTQRTAGRVPEPLDTHYDFIVCGSPLVMMPCRWPTNLGSGRDWQFMAQPNPLHNGSAILRGTAISDQIVRQ